jgi:hypothetical protein
MNADVRIIVLERTLTGGSRRELTLARGGDILSPAPAYSSRAAATAFTR